MIDITREPQSAATERLALRISAAGVTRVLLAVVVTLQALNLAGQASKYLLGHGRLLGLVDMFFVNGEGNVPAWWSSMALLACAGLLALIAADERARRGRWTRHWTGLAAIFVLLSVDEAASFHELLIVPLRSAFGTTGLLHWAWVIVGAPVAVGVFFACVPLLRALPRETARRFFVAGAVFCGGALGVESLSGLSAVSGGTQTPLHALLVTAEESLEMLGVALFARALLLHLAAHAPRVALTFDAGAAPVIADGRRLAR